MMIWQVWCRHHLDGRLELSSEESPCYGLWTFDRPPVVETVLGVQFDPIEGLTNAHLGAFWATLGDAWPNVSDAPALDSSFEEFGNGARWQPTRLQLKLSREFAARIRISDAARHRLIQVQNRRLHFNWIKRSGTEYPRYSNMVRPQFDQVLSDFRNYLSVSGLPPLRPNQWEVTYVNALPRGTVWNDPSEWGDVLADLSGAARPLDGLAAETFGAHWHFEIPPHRGRLHVEAFSGTTEDQPPIEAMILKLTARGPVVGDDDSYGALSAGLDLGRSVIVHAFKEITSPKAHRYWGLRS